MFFEKSKLLLLLFLAFILISIQTKPQELDKRLLESGKTFLKDGKYQLALEDFNTIINSYPDSPYVDDAKLQIAKYFLEIEKDYQTAMREFNELIERYGGTESAEAAYFYIGHINLITGENQLQYNEALANFERIARLYPQSDWIDDALLNSALSYEKLKDYDRAISKLDTLIVDHPQFEDSSKAYLLKAKYFIFLGNNDEAFYVLQELRNKYPDSPEADKALKTLTLLYRLAIRPKLENEPIYKYDSNFRLKVGENIKEAKDIAINNQGEIFIADAKKDAIFQFSSEGDYMQQFFLKDPKSIFLDKDGEMTACNKKGIMIGKRYFTAAIETEKGPKELEEIVAFIKDRFGRYLIADKNSKKLLYFDKDFKSISEISNTFFRDFSALAIDSKDQIWVLEKNDKSLMQFDLNGKTLHKLSSRNKEYEFSEAVDIAIDTCDNMYVLDKKQKKVFIFNASGELLASFSLLDSSGQQLKNPILIEVDEAGGLYIFDNENKNLVKYF